MQKINLFQIHNINTSFQVKSGVYRDCIIIQNTEHGNEDLNILSA